RRLTRRDHVLDDEHLVARRKAAFDAPAGAVRLSLATHGEGVEGHAVCTRSGRDRVGHGGGAEGEAPDGARGPPAGLEPRQAQGSDDGEPFARHCGGPGIDVVGGALAGGEHEVAAGDRAFAQELAKALEESGFVCHVVAYTTTISS